MRHLAICFFISLVNSFKAQTITIGASYDYIYAKQWDNMIQTYNYSRPFLENQQPVISSGFGLNSAYLFKSDKLIKHGVKLNYNYFRTTANSPDFKNSINLQTLNLGYNLLFSKTKNVICFSVGALGGLMNRRLNDEPFEVDEKRLRAFGIGGQLSASYQYVFAINDKYNVAPFIEVNYVPYYFCPKAEEVINQTTELVIDKSNTSILGFKIGFNFLFFTR